MNSHGVVGHDAERKPKKTSSFWKFLLEVHGRLRNAKIAKKYFLMLEWGMPYTIGKQKRRASQQDKETPIKNLIREIRSQ